MQIFDHGHLKKKYQRSVQIGKVGILINFFQTCK